MNSAYYSFESTTDLPEIYAFIFIFLFGAIIGSFLNALIHRLPESKSVLFPKSACPKCHSPIKPFDNVPILSWFVLGGNCRNCRNKISVRYPFVEALTGIIFYFVLFIIGFNLFLPFALVFVSALIVLIFIDAENMILPNAVNFPLFLFNLSARFLLPFFGLSQVFYDLKHFPLQTIALSELAVSVIGGLLGAFAGAGFLWLIGAIWKRLRNVEAMGFGDVKMMFAVGTLLGWQLSFLTIFMGAFIGAVVGIIYLYRNKSKNLQTQIPFGVFLGIAAIISLLFGEKMISWYLSNFIP